MFSIEWNLCVNFLICWTENWKLARLLSPGPQSAEGETASSVFTLCFHCLSLPNGLVYLSGRRRKSGVNMFFLYKGKTTDWQIMSRDHLWRSFQSGKTPSNVINRESCLSFCGLLPVIFWIGHIDRIQLLLMCQLLNLVFTAVEISQSPVDLCLIWDRQMCWNLNTGLVP